MPTVPPFYQDHHSMSTEISMTIPNLVKVQLSSTAYIPSLPFAPATGGSAVRFAFLGWAVILLLVSFIQDLLTVLEASLPHRVPQNWSNAVKTIKLLR